MDVSVNNIRQVFLDYFKEKDHKIVPSAPMVLKDDPTLMFTNAGMNQFKDIFLGNNKAPYVRAADTQKCLRVSGKHNDLEEVGVDTYHHTMFEMLGNWSFGDYFKQEAIDWAWELLTDVYGIDKDRLYVTVFEGDEQDGLEADVEAEDIWKKHLDSARILRCDKKDNFWEMGEVGPCGPCSEIHVDIRKQEDRDQVNGLSLVNQDHPEVIEIWNLVFMQFNRMANGSLVDLPQKHVDTGMGLERLAVVLQAKQSNYDTDVFSGLIAVLEEITGKKYGYTDSKEDVAFRVISDHVRAVSFSIADGQLPSNNGAGYVIRRILRRAIRYGYSFLNLNEAFVYKLVKHLVDSMGQSFPEIKAQQDLITKVIKEEEESFLRTLSKGIERLNKITSLGKNVSGKDAFELYDTFGFPFDLTQLIVSELGLEVDSDQFQVELEKQKNRSRSSNVISTDDWIDVEEGSEQASFIGYDEVAGEVRISRYRKTSEKGKTFYQLVFNQTPFYPEGGGQVGDTGLLKRGEDKLAIIDTRKENDLIIHKAKEIPNDLKGTWQAEINAGKRALTASNHSATHLLHHVLRDRLGTHVEQKGSLVNAKHLTFDFSHFEKISDKELVQIELEVNRMINAAYALNEFRNIPIDEAKAKGAMSLFGEKYGDTVRMIQFGDSKELCGGTHVQNTSEIRRFKILAESSVAAGIRRIEAITGEVVFEWFENQSETLTQVRGLVNNPKDTVKSVQALIDENKKLKVQVEGMEKMMLQQTKQELKAQASEVNGITVISGVISMSSKNVKDMAFQLKQEFDNLYMVVGNVEGPKVGLSVMMSDAAMQATGSAANELIKETFPLIGGGGGGQAFFATAGGKKEAGLSEAVELLVGKI